MNKTEIATFHANVLARRQTYTSINDHADIQAIFAAALLLKNATVKAQVFRVLMGGLDNADDSVYIDFGRMEQADYACHGTKARSEFWRDMFYGSCRGLSCEDGYADNGHARNWLQARGLVG